ncbi:hypothetical protein A3G67_03700 [Candidatus Roizmanbacteria bacterium RIFCSPLOWO2_12_FULL_40_12]|uniref:Uncharacterized protein n=1 Tax=Candidatus Roizmanbacteria bacterium RIFCSPLOWO2_01_FULL_40_42 TaxID=1802066 RepID=A0A1F7J5P6_9BACT|nr:MAG: hypothetical protein A2779_03335 [Candidatus Roizmanbacteria bacterium RIFCSPHIGHO2_01_FULL_40_98]OGK28371.1 MAG: hypothetical protein A3C31_00700 [Candidatus Roizmanbacteria bacterium RIFCSPHIGHO2_02_FULL_40_53]OGK30607.1 MAG: hypothetical protein A2W49_03385 [Candidatus Roizmanbacteria bacterium RIFCSPHIGHO2_12_41_18]OGK37021.1 MAG: hypothetical protein A3E69_00960 [Candidatus Roizmanbacteria bacterium RIFCSPHIGHO2_12_FULL_40_130]OGK50927.1 MAG: hypothetical protein A3B50_01470 [Candi
MGKPEKDFRDEAEEQMRQAKVWREQVLDDIEAAIDVQNVDLKRRGKTHRPHTTVRLRKDGPL